MKTLIVYYSRTGNTRMIAEEIAKHLKADIEEVKDTQNRKGIIGYLRSGYQANRKKLTSLEKPVNNPTEYDLIIIGTPIWAGKMSVPIRTYLNQFKDEIEQMAIFCTYGGSGLEGTLEDIAIYTGKVPRSTLGIKNNQIKSGEYLTRVQEFIESMSI
jgi:flavodoxin